MRQKLCSITQRLSLPSICTVCNQFHKGSMAVCTFCMKFMTPLGLRCKQCAYPLPQTNYLLCGQCIKKPPYFDNAYIGYQYNEPLRGLLHQFKYRNNLYLGSFLSHLIRHTLPNITQDSPTPCLIPIPMHPQKIKQRGFNQAAVLAKLLAKQLHVAYDLTNCKKIINTVPQASLNGEQRQKNLHLSFAVNSIPYSHVILIDDLLTTGSTANELAHMLKQAGVARVDISCCARAVYE